MFWYGLFAGFIIGGIVGLVFMAQFKSAGDTDRQRELIENLEKSE